MMENNVDKHQWLGEIPDSWHLIKGRYLFSQRVERGNSVELQLLSPTQKYGVIPQTLYEKLSGASAVKLDEKTKLNTLKTIHKGDFCISLRSFQGGFEYSKYEGVCSPAYQVFYPIHSVDRQYYKYLFKDQCFIDKMNSYTLSLRDGKNIAFADFGNTYLPVPPIEEQKKISNLLNKKCLEIEALYSDIEKQIETLEEYKKSVITEAVTKGLDPDVEMKDSGIEWIGNTPKDWSVERMQEIGTYKKGPFGSAITKNMFVEKDDTTYKVYEQKNAIYKNAELGYYYIPFSIYEGLKEFTVIPQDIIVSCAGTIGECYIMPNNMEKGIINQALMRIRLNENINKNYFIYVFDVVLTYANLKYSNGSAMKNIPPFSVLKKLGIPLPSVQEQEKIANYLDNFCNEIDGAIEEKKEQLEVLDQYKKSLIYEYVTGKKEVPED